MAKYDKKSQEKVRENVRELKKGKLRSGSGKKVKSRKQAIAIGLSEARKEGSKAPRKKTAKKGGKKGGAKKTSKKSSSKKTAKKSSSKKTGRKSAKKKAAGRKGGKKSRK